MSRHLQRLCLGAGAASAITVAIVCVAALSGPPALIVAGLSALVLISTATVMLDVRHRTNQLGDRLTEASERTRRILTRIEPLRGIPADLEQYRRTLAEVDVAIAELHQTKHDRSMAIGWQAIAARTPLEAPFVEGGVDPWAVVSVRSLLDELPSVRTVLVAGHGLTAVLCAMLAPPTTEIIALTAETAEASATVDEARRRRLGGLRVVTVPLTYGGESGVEGYEYDLLASSDLPAVGILLVAGPAWTTGPGIRNRMLPALEPVLAEDAWVIAADPHHPQSRAMRVAWAASLGPTRVLKQIDDRRFRLLAGGSVSTA